MSDAPETPASDEPTPGAPESIVTLNIEEEVRQSYLTYASSVIQARALPEVCDGLKPAQRRILVAMNDLNLGPGARFRKCAKIVGEAMGNYHPHGDSAIYQTLARMGQWWNMRYPLIQPQGNFGNITGDGPAAMRYTEARMTPIAMELLRDLKLDTVLLHDNYDGTRKEPQVLPAKFPNLICNGSSGIAVGLATSMPPHNLTEVCDGLTEMIDIEHLAEEPRQITVPELMEHIKGPDFPTGGVICGRAGIAQSYREGQGGRAIVRAKVHREEIGKKEAIVVDEIPYQLQLTNVLIKEIVEAIRSGRIEGIDSVNNDTGRKCKPPQVRVVITLKRDAIYDVVLNNLFKHTSLQRTFSLNLWAVHRPELDKVQRKPAVMGLRAILDFYIKHREDVIRRRTEFLLAKDEAEAHKVEGLLRAIHEDVLDAVIALIRSSGDRDEAAQRLVAKEAAGAEFTMIQARAILALSLGALTGLEREQLQQKYEELLARIADYRDILARKERRYQMIKDDLAEMKDKYGDARRTAIEGPVDDFEDEDLIADEQVVVTLTSRGFCKRTSLDLYRAQKRGGKGVTGANMADDDFVERLIVTNIKDYILFFTNMGQLYWLKIYRIPEGGRNAKGRHLSNLIQLREGEVVQSVIPVTTFDEDRFLVFATRAGQIKKTALSAYSNVRTVGVRAIKLDEEDQLVRVRVCGEEEELLIGTRMGMSIRFPSSDCRPMGRVAAGVRGIRLDRGDEVVDMAVVDEDMSMLTVSEKGFGKRSLFQAYRLQGRGGRGVINLRTSEKTGLVVAVRAVSDDDQLLLITANGQVVRTSTNQLRIIGRATQGVKLIDVADDDRFVSLARLPSDMLEDEEEDDDASDASEASGEAPGEAEEGAVEPDGDVE